MIHYPQATTIKLTLRTKKQRKHLTRVINILRECVENDVNVLCWSWSECSFLSFSFSSSSTFIPFIYVDISSVIISWYFLLLFTRRKLFHWDLCILWWCVEHVNFLVPLLLPLAVVMVQSIYNTVCLPNNIQPCALHNIFIIQVCMVVWKCVKTDPFHLPSPILRHFASYPTYSFFFLFEWITRRGKKT